MFKFCKVITHETKVFNKKIRKKACAKKEITMGKFNEIQQGIPDLGKTYWQELSKTEQETNLVPDIVKMNCQTIFSSETTNINIKPSIFDK